MNILPKNRPYNLLTAILLLPLLTFASDNIPIESSVIFNTSCARCHEGECSGRMSFHLPEAAAYQHIRRHGGELSLTSIQPLFKLLRYMKEQCRFYPLPHALIHDQLWLSKMLDKFHSPSKQAYFIPLGILAPGTYHLLFDELANTKFSIEIINDEFDFSDMDSLYRESCKKGLIFYVAERSEHFLRLSAQEPVTLKKLELKFVQ